MVTENRRGGEREGTEAILFVTSRECGKALVRERFLWTEYSRAGLAGDGKGRMVGLDTECPVKRV